MAQLERRKKLSDSPKSPNAQHQHQQTSPTFEQLLRVEETYWSNASPSGRACHDHEVCPSHCPSETKKSVLSKVKETAKKLKYSLSGRRRHGLELHDEHNLVEHHHDANHMHNHLDHNNDLITPAWGVTLEDDYDHERDDDPEYLGAPMYESEAAPECLKETARQHPRAEPVVAESHRAPDMAKHEASNTSMIANTTQAVADKLGPACAAVSDAAHNMNTTDMIKSTTQTVADKLAPACAAVSDATHHINTDMISNTTQTVADKLAPACAVVSDATHQIANKIAGMTVTSPETQQEMSRYSGEVAALPRRQEAKTVVMSDDAGNLKQYTELKQCADLKQYAGGSPQTYDKGVSVKEYFLNKLEPGEDERALSQAITEAISPRKSTGESGVVDKMKEAVTSFFRQEDASNSTEKTAHTISAAPVSSEVEPIVELNRASHAEKTANPSSPALAASIHAEKTAIPSSPALAASVHSEKTAIPSSPALAASNSPTVVQLKRVAPIHAEKPASPSPVVTDTINIQENSPQPQLNRIASVHIRSNKVFADSSTSSPLIPVSTNAHEVYEEENNGRILQTN